MGTRRTISLLLCISFAIASATGMLFVPFIRLVMGLNNESLLRMIHFYSSDALAVLIVIHIILNRKALMNYIRTARVRSIFSYTIAVLLFIGVIGFGLYGSDVGIAAPWRAEELRRACSPGPDLVTFPEDFEDGKTDGWDLGSGWEVGYQDTNYVLSCQSETWSVATPDINGWFNYELTARVKVDYGEFEIKFRTTETPFRAGYGLHSNQDGLHLNREIDNEHIPLSYSPSSLELSEWHQVTICLNNTSIEVYCDDELTLDYTDGDLPLIFGGFYFVSGPDSRVFFDDIFVNID